MGKTTKIDKESGYPLENLGKNDKGLFHEPVGPCGILAFYDDPKKGIMWGCVKTNRGGVKALAPATGAQDILIFKKDKYYRLEHAKPFPKNLAEEIDCKALYPFISKPFKNDKDNPKKNYYQQILHCLEKNGFELYIESPLGAAVRETREEHGVDLHKQKGRDNHLLQALFEFEPQRVLAKRGETLQTTYLAHLESPKGVKLKYETHEETKIPWDLGEEYYEKGTWVTLEDIRSLLNKLEKTLESKKSGVGNRTLNSLNKGLEAFKSRFQLMEKFENTMQYYLSSERLLEKKTFAGDTLIYKTLPIESIVHKNTVSNNQSTFFQPVLAIKDVVANTSCCTIT